MDNLSANELRKKYKGTCACIFLKENKKEIPVYFEDIYQDNETNQWQALLITWNKEPSLKESLIGKVKQTKLVLPCSNFSIKPMPSRQVFDFKGRTFSYSRSPNRQWQKGLCQANTKISDSVLDLFKLFPNLLDLKKEENFRTPDKFNLEFFTNLFIGNYTHSLQDAIQQIQDFGLLSRAIDEKYYLSLFPSDEKSHMLFRCEMPLAFYNQKIDTFTLVHKIYNQEVSDFIQRHNLNSRIED